MRTPVQLCAVQAAWPLSAYADGAAFRRHLEGYLAQLAPLRRPEVPCLVAFPEFIGLPLVFLGRVDRLQGCRSWKEAAGVTAQSCGEEVAAACSRWGVGPVRGLLLARAEEIREVYAETFRRLAREHGVYLVAGSAPLPRADRDDGRVFNTSLLFRPDGALLGEQRKCYPFEAEGTSEGLDLCPASPSELGVLSTPLGRVGIVICYDAWQEDVMGTLAAQGAEIVVQPSANAGPWNEWQEEDWERGLLRQVREKPFRIGVNPMMVGPVFAPGDEYDCQGRSSILGPQGYLARAAELPWSEYRKEELVVHLLEAAPTGVE